ncbi:hypothetical protein CEXT_87641 [Caerostris extrusa]|uniref:Uncharacterized protein n=1 Tax=Caerostris extrusa TaxID=172846 RepID=A0AAV4Y201_CAEEX|nr:hypothetical protein CEXT_87641 [Caerostris extrusa]
MATKMATNPLCQLFDTRISILIPSSLSYHTRDLHLSPSTRTAQGRMMHGPLQGPRELRAPFLNNRAPR